MKSPARRLDFNRLTRKIRKKRIANFRESGREFGIRWKSMLNEMEDIYRSIENAPDLSEHEKEKLAADFTKGNEALISEWVTGMQSCLESVHTNVGKLRKGKKK